MNPAPEAWWWSPKETFRSWIKLTSVLILAIDLGFLANLAPRFLIGGPDPLSALILSFQSVVGLFAAQGLLSKDTFVPGLQESLEPVFERIFTRLKKINLPIYNPESSHLVTALLILSIISTIFVSLSGCSELFNQWGLDYSRHGDMSDAQDRFERAIAIDPGNADAHYNLGNLYERVQDLNKAKTEYQVAAQSGLSAAYNNLGRLYILEKKYDTASVLLLKGKLALEGNPQSRSELSDEEVRLSTKYNLYKNLGWAYFGQQRYVEAETQLKQAIDLNSEDASAYCLIAQVYEGSAKNSSKETDKRIYRDKAKQNWCHCRDKAKRYKPDQAKWLSQAQKSC